MHSSFCYWIKIKVYSDLQPCKQTGDASFLLPKARKSAATSSPFRMRTRDFGATFFYTTCKWIALHRYRCSRCWYGATLTTAALTIQSCKIYIYYLQAMILMSKWLRNYFCRMNNAIRYSTYTQWNVKTLAESTRWSINVGFSHLPIIGNT